MQISEILELNSIRDEVVALVTDKDVECILSNNLGIKKQDWDSKIWDEIVSRSKKAIVRKMSESSLQGYIGSELADFFKEGSVALGDN